MQADILFEDGCIRCVKSSNDAAGIALQFDLDQLAEAEPGVDRLGIMTLHTCLLPDREEPYLLSLELARRRIMTFLNKLEDWGLFDISPDDPVMQMFERARQAFTDALVAHRNGDGGFSAEADRLARRALALAVDAVSTPYPWACAGTCGAGATGSTSRYGSTRARTAATRRATSKLTCPCPWAFRFGAPI